MTEQPPEPDLEPDLEPDEPPADTDETDVPETEYLHPDVAADDDTIDDAEAEQTPLLPGDAPD